MTEGVISVVPKEIFSRERYRLFPKRYLAEGVILVVPNHIWQMERYWLFPKWSLAEEDISVIPKGIFARERVTYVVPKVIFSRGVISVCTNSDYWLVPNWCDLFLGTSDEDSKEREREKERRGAAHQWMVAGSDSWSLSAVVPLMCRVLYSYTRVTPMTRPQQAKLMSCWTVHCQDDLL